MPFISFLYNIFKILLIIALPFMTLIRGAVYLHYEKWLNPFLSLMISGVFTTMLLVIYYTSIYGYVSNNSDKLFFLKRRFQVAGLLVFIFLMYGTLRISNKNTQNEAISKEFYSLNPILRLGSSTLFLLDKKSIISDASRIPEDYQKMGLKTIKNSLHYKQKDGYAYALDLRTKNRSEIRNRFLPVYFYIMGFNTLRHTGTGDHLHVSMPCRYRKV